MSERPEEVAESLARLLGGIAEVRKPCGAVVKTGGPLLDVPHPLLRNDSFEARSEEYRMGFEGYAPKDIWEWFQCAPDPAAELDLHGYTRAEAFDALDNFLGRCLEDGCAWVRVIHGRGAGVLKRSVRGWLASCDHVASYIEEKRRHQSLLVELKSLPPMNAG